MNESDISKTLHSFFVPGDVFEVRVLQATRKQSSAPHTESGYFDYAHIDDVAGCIGELAGYAGCYFTINPVIPACQARCRNRLEWGKRGSTTGDKEIVKRRWLYIDVDATRPAGISATDEEKGHTEVLASSLSDHLRGMGWPEPIRIDSGNGTQLHYPIDMATTSTRVKDALTLMKAMDNDHAEVDGVVHNASRICRLPGTWNRKGDDTEDRPHRLSSVSIPEKNSGPVSESLFDSTFPPSTKKKTKVIARADVSTDAISIEYNAKADLPALLEKHGWVKVSENNENSHWRRPGKTDGQSASYNGEVFYVFSSSAQPFEPEGYSAFGAFTMLECGGDYSRAYERLRREGYGEDLFAGLDLSRILSRSAHVVDSVVTEDDVVVQLSSDDPGPLPEDLLYVPGFINDVIEHSLATAPYPNRVLSFCGALTMQSYLCARRVRDAIDNRPNVYLIALASSGVGKDHPRTVNSDISHHAALLKGVADSFASGEGIEDAMFESKSMLFQTDEIDAIFGSVSMANDSRSAMIIQMLLKFYSASNSRYVLRKKSGQVDPLPIDQPSLTLYGTAVPQFFYKSLSPKMLSNGLFARTMVFEAGARSRGRMPSSADLPQPIIDRAIEWANLNPSGSGLQAFFPKPLTVKDTPEAIEYSNMVWALADDEYDKYQALSDDASMALWARSFEKTRKLALLYACSVSAEAPQITKDAIEWAWRIVYHQTKRMIFMAGLYVTDGDFDGDCKRVLEILAKWQSRRGVNLMPQWDLLRKTGWSEKKMDEVIHTLILREQIDVVMGERGARKPKYRLRTA